MDKLMGKNATVLYRITFISTVASYRSVDILQNFIRRQFLVLFAYLVTSKANLICELDSVTCLSVIRKAETKVQRS